MHDEVSSKGVGEPEPIVVEGATVETEDHFGGAKARQEMVNPIFDIPVVCFLISLSDHDDSWKRDFLKLKSLDGNHSGVGGVSIVSTSSAVELNHFSSFFFSIYLGMGISGLFSFEIKV